MPLPEGPATQLAPFGSDALRSWSTILAVTRLRHPLELEEHRLDYHAAAKCRPTDVADELAAPGGLMDARRTDTRKIRGAWARVPRN